MCVVWMASRAINRLAHFYFKTFIWAANKHLYKQCHHFLQCMALVGVRTIKSNREQWVCAELPAWTYMVLCTWWWVSQVLALFFSSGEVWGRSDIRYCWQCCQEWPGLCLCFVQMWNGSGGSVIDSCARWVRVGTLHTPGCELGWVSVSVLDVTPRTSRYHCRGEHTSQRVWECAEEWEMMARGWQESGRKDFWEHALKHWEQLPLPRGCSWQVQAVGGGLEQGSSQWTKDLQPQPTISNRWVDPGTGGQNQKAAGVETHLSCLAQ